jgi:hypothetical protein
MRTRDMEYAQIDYNHEEKLKWLYVSLGNGGTESNGHREGKEEKVDLVETMRSLQRDVLSYIIDNERIIRSQEEKNHINAQFLQSLNMLQKQINKN